MTEKLFTGTLNKNHKKQQQKKLVEAMHKSVTKTRQKAQYRKQLMVFGWVQVEIEGTIFFFYQLG